MNPAMLILRLRLLALRLGAGNLLCLLLLLLALPLWLVWLPHLRAERDATREARTKATKALQQPLPVAAAPAPETRQTNLDNFYKTLGKPAHLEEQVKTLFALARKQGLTLSQGEYKALPERHGKYLKYQIILPLKGSYSVIRQFGEQALLTIPFASLDEMTFKRDNIGNRVLEAKLRFTLYLSTDSEAQP